jgi:lambda repressor-like predicted transcriptional regulator
MGATLNQSLREMTTAEALRQAASDIIEATERRDKAIAKRQKQGAGLRQIAEEAGMHHSGVAKVLARKAVSGT